MLQETDFSLTGKQTIHFAFYYKIYQSDSRSFYAMHYKDQLFTASNNSQYIADKFDKYHGANAGKRIVDCVTKL